MINNNEITLRDDNYNLEKCTLLATFYSKEMDKCYAIYTDKELNEDGTSKIWASRYRQENKKIIFEEIKEEREWDIIDKYIKDNMK